MIKVTRICNEWLRSNTFVIQCEGAKDVWLVDCGDYCKIKEWLLDNNAEIKGILVTHSHHDHIYGIAEALTEYQHLKVVLSSNRGKEYMKDSKLNMSRYTDKPVEIESDSFHEVTGGDSVELWDGITAQVINTPGHTPDSVTYLVNDFMFTGDTYLPFVKPTARSKGGNKEELKTSLAKIKSMIDLRNYKICPGHFEITSSENLTNDIKCIITRIH